MSCEIPTSCQPYEIKNVFLAQTDEIGDGTALL